MGWAISAVPPRLEITPWIDLATDRVDGNDKKNMRMVLHTANHQRLHLVLAGDAAYVWPKTLLQVRLDQRTSFLGREETVH